ncbi:MAG: hypothetical protein P8Q95_03130, partial [Candidatus Poseidoniaceae archaeon]|nr:hypothetical protein [Candidatus Poseidoniaceae archaeon]
MRRHIVALLILILLGQSLSNLNSNNYDIDSLNDDLSVKPTQKSNATLTLTDIDSTNIIDIYAGGHNSCFLNSNYEFYCWGEGSHMILGRDGGTTWVPTKISFGNEYVVEHSSETTYACALSNAGNVYCWGGNNYGRLGIGATAGDYAPTMLDLGIGRTATEISVGSTHNCALLDNNYVSCWGDGRYGRIGNLNNAAVQQTSPLNTTIIPDGLNVTSISTGREHVCAILNDNSALCWGSGPIGSTSGKRYYFGNQIPISIKSGNGFSCVILDNYSVNCWGENQHGTLGINSTTDKLTPQYVDLGLGRTAKSISTQYDHICAILDDNSLKCWGKNEFSGYGGYLGLGHINSPILVPNSVNIPPGRILKSVKIGVYHTCVLFADGSIECFGSNQRSQLGYSGGDASDMNHISNSISPINTPSIIEELTENQFVNLSLRSGRMIDFPLFDYQYNLDLPNGLTFNNSTFVISGMPQYTNQVYWNFSIGNGSVYYNGTYQLQVLSDTDGDGIANKYDDNDDDDLWFDELDGCPIMFGNSTLDVFGCIDSDGDGYSDQGDKFPQDSSQQLDSDQDGYGDNTEGNLGDDCPRTYGTSNRNNTFGCEDFDFDGWADFEDEYINDSSQWKDTDRDGYGDELNGFQGDACPKSAGNSTLDRFGCRDTDNDGWSDIGDALPMNPTQWIDRDGD